MTADVLKQAAMAGIHKTTTDHAEIRSWIAGRGGRPIRLLRPVGQEIGGDLGIDFSGRDDPESFQVLPWDEFFRTFEARHLAFVYQVEGLHGQEGLFNAFIERDKIKQGSKDRSQLRTGRKVRGPEKGKFPDRKQ